MTMSFQVQAIIQSGNERVDVKMTKIKFFDVIEKSCIRLNVWICILD